MHMVGRVRSVTFPSSDNLFTMNVETSIPHFYILEVLNEHCSDAYLFFCAENMQVDLGIAVQRACQNHKLPLKFLYPLEASIKDKIEAIARSYGAAGVEYSEQVILCHLYISCMLILF